MDLLTYSYLLILAAKCKKRKKKIDSRHFTNNKRQQYVIEVHANRIQGALL